MQNNNSDIVDVVGVTPIPSPLPSSTADPPPTDEGGGEGIEPEANQGKLAGERVDVVENAGRTQATVLPSTNTMAEYSSPRPLHERSPSNNNQEEGSPNVDEEDDSRIRCICENEEDDGFTIQCDSCLVWQHAVCVGIARHNVPETFLCEECRPSHGMTTATAPMTPTAGATRKAKRKRTSSHSNLGSTNSIGATSSSSSNITGTISGLPPLNEITSNIVATEALPLLKKLDEQYERIRLRMPRLARDIPLGQVNFELCPGLVALPSRGDLAGALKATEVRELRGRNYGRRSGGSLARVGVFAAEDVDPGAIVGEYLGHVQPANVLEGRRVENVVQSHVLFSAVSPNLIVDARKFGSTLRYIRRSCRANCEVKIVLLPSAVDDISERVHWCLFARNTIREGEELFLPFDYGPDGNQHFRYECCCLYPELCLADDMQSNQLIDVMEGSGASSGLSTGSAMMGEKGHSKKASGSVGISSSLLSPDHRRSSGNLVSTAQAATSRSRTAATAAASGGSERKLSREERKLQQYIEFIERMELAEKRQAGRRSASGAGSSHSGAASPPPSGTTSSPKKGATSSSVEGRKSSSKTTSPKKPKIVDGDDETKSTSATETAPLPPSPSAPTAKRVLPLKKFLVKSFEDRRASSASSSSLPESPIKQRSRITGGEEENAGLVMNNEDEVDVMAVDGTDSEGGTNGNQARSQGQYHGQDQHLYRQYEPEHQEHPVLPETPSKKRVSLSDYLSRRKSSPVDKIPNEAVRDPIEMTASGERDPSPAPSIKEDPYVLSTSGGELSGSAKTTLLDERATRRTMSPSPSVPHVLPISSNHVSSVATDAWSQGLPRPPHSQNQSSDRYDSSPAPVSEALRRESHPSDLGRNTGTKVGIGGVSSPSHPYRQGPPPPLYHHKRPHSHDERSRDRHNSAPGDHRAVGRAADFGGPSRNDYNRDGGANTGNRGRDPRAHGQYRDYRDPSRGGDHYGTAKGGGNTRDYGRGGTAVDPRDHPPNREGNKPAGPVLPHSPSPSYANGDRRSSLHPSSATQHPPYRGH